MPTGTKLVIPNLVISDTTAPILSLYDQIESAGSLMLTETGHPQQPWPAGVPANGATTIPNVVAPLAAALTGQSASNLRPVLAATMPATSLEGERTPKGGLHIAVAQLSAGETFIDNSLFNLMLPDAIESYIIANPNNDYYMSCWYRITRAAIAGSVQPIVAGFGNSTSFVGNFGIILQVTSALPTPNQIGVNRDGNVNTPGAPSRLAAAYSAWTGNVPAGSSTFNSHLFAAGAVGAYSYFVNSDNSQWQSAVFYRTYLEDLTASGRTWSQVNAIDAAMFAAAFGVGGRYYNDTFTSPATMLAS